MKRTLICAFWRGLGTCKCTSICTCWRDSREFAFVSFGIQFSGQIKAASFLSLGTLIRELLYIQLYVTSNQKHEASKGAALLQTCTKPSPAPGCKTIAARAENSLQVGSSCIVFGGVQLLTSLHLGLCQGKMRADWERVLASA